MLDDQTIINDKWRLVWEIVSQGAENRDLREADLSWAFLGTADLTGADLTKAILTVADLTGAKLGGVNLSEADLTGTKYDKNTQWPDDFDPISAGAILVEEEPDSL